MVTILFFSLSVYVPAGFQPPCPLTVSHGWVNECWVDELEGGGGGY
jgi:hypothetical protein